jgi:CDP-glucose 4,6-dehydratase
MAVAAARAFWRGKTVAVAGATGFLGGWLVRRLLGLDAAVVALVRDPAKRSQVVLDGLLPLTAVEQGRLDDPDFIDRVFTRHRIDVFFHTAAAADVTRVLDAPLDCFRSCAVSTWLVLDEIRRRQPWCIGIVSSSDKAYGAQALPYRESSPLAPIHPYEVSKASQDLATQSYGKVYGVPVAVTRCGNYFGPYDFNFDRLVPGVCRAIASGQTPRLRSDGRFTRDFLYIEDAADAQLLLAEAVAADPSLYGEVFNFSYGEEIEVVEVVRRIMRLAGVTLDPIVEGTATSEIRHMRVAPDRARARLNWRPPVGFDEGLQRTTHWYAAFLAGQPELAPSA